MTTVQVYFLILFIGLILVTFSLGWFTKMVWDNPDIIDEIKNISKQYKAVADQKMPGKSFDLLKMLYDCQQRHGVKRLTISREGALFKDEGGQLASLSENVMIPFLGLKVATENEITEEQKTVFRNLLLDIPIFFLRPGLGINRANSNYDLAVTREGAALIEMSGK